MAGGVTRDPDPTSSGARSPIARLEQLNAALLQRLPPEASHALASRSARALGAIPGARRRLRRVTVPADGALAVGALGRVFASPLGAAAGVDKNATWFEELGALGFAFVEVGTVTAQPQPGNPKPRIVRLPDQRALLNKMGFPNRGASDVAKRLRARSRETIVGVNVGKSKVAPLEHAAADYRQSVRILAPLADYLVLNVSSPNTPGLRELQAPERLRELIGGVRAELASAVPVIPLLVKVSPDLSDEELDGVAELACELGLAGIVAVNTTVGRGLISPSAPPAAAIDGGGVSGVPLKPRALEVLRRLYARVSSQMILISVGGIGTPSDAWERILAGATLVQAYTGFVYGGPAWPASVNRELARRVREAGARSIAELVGSSASSASSAFEATSGDRPTSGEPVA